MKTYKEKLTAGLLVIGYKQIQSRSHYAEFIDKDNSKRHVFVGNAGALRVGECASRSWSIGDPTRQTAFYKSVLDKAPKEVHKGEVVESIREYLEGNDI